MSDLELVSLELPDRIEGIIGQWWREMAKDDGVGVVYVEHHALHAGTPKLAAAVLAEIRETLLSDAAVEAACGAAITYGADAWSVPDEDKRQVAVAVAAALDAAGIREVGDGLQDDE